MNARWRADRKALQRQRRLAKARERRANAIARAAPKALNPYGSDDSGAEEAEDEADESDVEAGGAEEPELDDAAWAKAVQTGKISKGERLVPIDHSTIDYPAFRKVPLPHRCALVPATHSGSAVAATVATAAAAAIAAALRYVRPQSALPQSARTRRTAPMRRPSTSRRPRSGG